MTGLGSGAFLTHFITGSLTAALPLLLGGLGEQMSERAGVLNVGIEGMMLAGAYAGFVAAYDTGALWPGFLAGAVAGGLVAAPMILLCVRLALNQVVVGIALTLGAQGLTALLHHFTFSTSYPRLPTPAVLFGRSPLDFLALALCVALAWLYRRSFLGLHLAAAGERPAALDAAGVSVARLRGAAVLATGLLAGLGGAYLAEIGAGVFVPFMTNGTGFICIVLAMLARGRPFLVLAGALLFGASLSATTALQLRGVDVPSDVVQMLPFAVVMALLVTLGRGQLPAALGLPFRRGEH
jgi:general nucleoside transport system permease protein